MVKLYANKKNTNKTDKSGKIIERFLNLMRTS